MSSTQGPRSTDSRLEVSLLNFSILCDLSVDGLQGKYDYGTIHQIVDTTPVLHVSFPPTGDDPFSAVLPMIGCTGSFESISASKEDTATYVTPGSFPDEDETPEEDLSTGPREIYLHGHAASRLFKRPEDERIPVTIGATTMQGVVLSLTPFHNSCNYASAVVQGYASMVTSEAERLYALTRITDNLVTGRWDRSRNPPTKAEMTTTGVLKVEIVSASAKVRVGGPSDDRHDLKNEEVVNSVWTGVVPCWTQFGEPVGSSYNKVKKLPPYLRTWIENENQKGQKLAIDAINQAKK
jgi:nitroimidazol reductase NimA-like FMN-containing flavoprotein (pyridoxamine 5'-phosphate oxidase superfamily)